jgi:hypothetical protein
MNSPKSRPFHVRMGTRIRHCLLKRRQQEIAVPGLSFRVRYIASSPFCKVAFDLAQTILVSRQIAHPCSPLPKQEGDATNCGPGLSSRVLHITFSPPTLTLMNSPDTYAFPFKFHSRVRQRVRKRGPPQILVPGLLSRVHLITSPPQQAHPISHASCPFRPKLCILVRHGLQLRMP